MELTITLTVLLLLIGLSLLAGGCIGYYIGNRVYKLEEEQNQKTQERDY